MIKRIKIHKRIFIPLEKTTDFSRWYTNSQASAPLDSKHLTGSAHTVSPVRKVFSNGVRGRSSLTGFIIIIICLITPNLIGCVAKKKSQLQEAIPVQVMKVKLHNLSRSLEYVGNIKAQDEAVVYPRTSGKIIEKIMEDGAAVTKGDTILFIDRDEVGLTFEKAPVESPLTGTIGRIYVDKGVNVNPQTPVALVVNMDKVKIDLDIPEKYLPHLSLEQRAIIKVDAYPAEEFIGNITKISPVLDIETRSAPIEITLDNDTHRLKSGMFASVKLILEEHNNVPVILKEAIMGKQLNTYVYVASGNRVVSKKVVLGINEGPYFEVTEGLKPDDLVVIMGQQRLYDNAPVTVEMEHEDAINN